MTHCTSTWSLRVRMAGEILKFNIGNHLSNMKISLFDIKEKIVIQTK